MEDVSPVSAGKPGLRTAAAQGLAWTALDRWGSRALGFVTVVLLARWLDPVAFGVVAAALIYTDYISLFVAQGLGYALIQRRDLEPGHLNAAFVANAGLGAAAFLISFLLAPWIAHWTGMPGLSAVLRWLALVLPLTALSRVQAALLTRTLRFRELAWRSLVMTLGGSATGIGLAVAGGGVWSLVAQQVSTAAVGLVVLWCVSDWRPGLTVTRRHLLDLYGYSIKIVADQQLVFLTRRLDEILVGALLGAAALGTYSIAKRLVTWFVDALNMSISNVLFPLLARVQDAPERVRRGALSSLRLAAVVILPAYVGLAATANETLLVLLGPNWSAATGPLAILALAGVFLATPAVVHPIFHALGRPGTALGLNAVRAASSAVLLPLGALGGLMGVSIAFAARAALAAVLDFVLLGRLMQWHAGVVFRAIAGPAMAALVMAVGVLGVTCLVAPASGFLGLAGAIVCGALLYAGALRLLDRGIWAELGDVLWRLPRLAGRRGTGVGRCAAGADSRAGSASSLPADFLARCPGGGRS